ncbi:hypothetical protein [Pararhodobacter zhoushanensis]|uniref:Outer membrane protein beta-barrel domain-containing protein n=1 Tax=Pararhodobacter zhoushanensis TaxID=2479545 RepID=A0ABT3GWB0_9RHOB|nr:hypothetical protein [Pararhodobacter zhoushanensis]MCW1931829.1 hypothetical protein [Pararhodobacter zhoushanensis]
MSATRASLIAIALVIAPGFAQAQTRAAITSLPSGFGMANGILGVSLSGLYGPYHPPIDVDGDIGIALGFGDAVNAIGFGISADITSLDDDFGDSGYFNLSAHRQFRMTNGYGSVNATVSGVGAYGTASGREIGGSLVASFITGSETRPYMISVGVANDLNMAQDVQGILGLGVGINEEWAVSAGVYGDNNSIGVSYFPAFMPNAVVQLSLRNLDDSDRRGIGFDFGYAFNLFGN